MMNTALSFLTLSHVAISLVGIASGFVVIYGFLIGKRFDRWTGLFLFTTIATSATGFLFPIEKLTPGIVIGMISLVVLAVAVMARYRQRLRGGWRSTYVVSAVFAQYLNFFVLIVQSFLKVPALHDMAPTQSEGPFVAAQAVTLLLFAVLGTLSALRFHGRDVESLTGTPFTTVRS